ncbi:uncharacterized protein [Equus asinus]|uniref:uncharacterized protein isoform X4 n=1 Tax=Equus asinus TaxID=9793 RepID=UPI0038F69BC4
MLRLKSEASLEAEFPQRRTLSAAVVAIGSCSPESWSPSRLCSLVPSELHMYQCHYLSLPSGIQLLVWEIITNPTESCDGVNDERGPGQPLLWLHPLPRHREWPSMPLSP